MGPRSDERGNSSAYGPLGTTATVLQWGRARMSAEMAERNEAREEE